MSIQDAKRAFMNGDEAVAHGVRLARAQVISAYPITPQTLTVEKLAEFVANGEMDCEYCYVESEHSALATAMGASLAGARTFTATSSQGLAYMCEMLHYVSGSRFPIVMMNANRTLAAPWNIFGDQRDSIAQRDSGWIQIYVENAQEALDMILQAYRIAEHEDVYIPVMVNLDGFVNTHTYEMVDIPSQAQADAFLAPFVSKNAVDFDNPRSYCMTAGTDWNTEFRIQQQQATLKAGELAESIDEEFFEIFHRRYGGMVESYRMEDAEVALCALGSVNGTIKDVVDELRAKGQKVGAVKIRYYRPFPVEFFKDLARRGITLGVIDRDISFGYEGALATEVRAAAACDIVTFICGLAGRDISKDLIQNLYAQLQQVRQGAREAGVVYADAKWPL